MVNSNFAGQTRNENNELFSGNFYRKQHAFVHRCTRIFVWNRAQTWMESKIKGEQNCLDGCVQCTPAWNSAHFEIVSLAVCFVTSDFSRTLWQIFDFSHWWQRFLWALALYSPCSRTLLCNRRFFVAILNSGLILKFSPTQMTWSMCDLLNSSIWEYCQQKYACSVRL